LSDTLNPAGWEPPRVVVSTAFEADIFLGQGPEVTPLLITNFVATRNGSAIRLWAFGEGDFLLYSDDMGVTWNNSLCGHLLADAGATMHPLLNWRREQRTSPTEGFGNSQIYGITQSLIEPANLLSFGKWNIFTEAGELSRVAYSCSNDFGATWQAVQQVPGLPVSRALRRCRGPIFTF